MNVVPEFFQPQMDAFQTEVNALLEAHPNLSRVELLFPDIHGMFRGKWLPSNSLDKLANGSVRLPRSAYFFDVWGNDVPEVGLAQEVGDPDGVCLPIPGSLAMVPWAEHPTAQVMMQMLGPGKDTLTSYDPRQVLLKQVEAFREKGLTPVVATELEFYVVSNTQGRLGEPQPAELENGFLLDQAQTYDLHALDQVEDLIDDIEAAARIQRLPIDTTIAEVGPGQFEINLIHVADALLAADQSVLLKRVIKRVIDRHNLLATFMAKPYSQEVGSGMHVHISLVDDQGHNVFSAADGQTAECLQHAIGGLIETAHDAQAIFAPHQNSYRRFQPGSFAPVTPCWGHDHRGAALRVPATAGAGARLEHRISGADANPYLVIAMVLAGMRYGIEHRIDPGEPLAIDGDVSDYPHLETEWRVALQNFADSTFVRDYLGEDYQRVFFECKHSEQRVFAQTITALEYDAYLRRL